MYDIKLCIGLLGVQPSLIMMLQEQADENNQPVTYKVLTSTNEPNINDPQLAAIIHQCDDFKQIEHVQCSRVARAQYALLTNLVEDLDDETLQKCDMLCSCGNSPRIIAFQVNKFIQRIFMEQKAWMNRNCIDTMINMLPDLVWFKDTKGAHLNVNDAFCRAVRKEKSDIIGRGHYYIWGLTEEQYSLGEYVCMETEKEVMETRKANIFREHVLTHNGLRQLRTYKAPVFDEENNIIGTVGLGHDITRMLRYKEQILRMVRRDFLTGLANRRYLYSFIKKNWRAGKLTTMFCDLDGFKHINDTYGHSAGDEALIIASTALKQVFDETMVARVGGDEFLIAYIGNYRMQDIVDKCEGLDFRLKTIFADDERFKSLTISIGLASTIFGVKTVDEVITCADRAMYEAKKTKYVPNRKCYHVYDDDN